MLVDKDEMILRTKALALSVIKLTESLPRTQTAHIIGRQVLRSATSVGANYRAACQARSRADFIAKLGIVAEEADETQYWMELLIDSGTCRSQAVGALMQEAKEITSIVVASLKTARKAKPVPARASSASVGRDGQIADPKSQIPNSEATQ